MSAVLRADIQALSPLGTVDFEDEWYETTSGTHFWMEWRFEAFRRQLRRVGADVGVPSRGLDVGGGHGVLRTQLEAATRWRVDVADVNAGALNRCPRGRGAILCYDVLQVHPELVGRYDVALLFDVLEHIEHPRPFLAATLAHLRPGGRLFINVPALPSLFSGYDTVLGHYRRYRPSTLAAELEGLPVRIDDTQYWGLPMLPLLALRAWVMRRAPASAAERARLARRGCEPPSRGTDRLLRGLKRVEATISPRPPIGTSILCACTRI